MGSSFPAKAFLASVAFLAACGGGSKVMSPPGTDPLPLAVGARWDYDVTRLGAGPAITTRESAEVATVETVDGWPTYTVDGVWPLPPRLQRTASELRVTPGTGSAALDRAIGDYVLLRLPLRVGDQWTAVAGVVDVADDGGESPPVPWDVRITISVSEMGTVQSALGSYRDAVKVVTDATFGPVGDTQPGHESRQLWIVPGIGVVKGTVSGWPVHPVHPYENTFELVGYRLP